jgi:hypothetical protein
MNEAETLMSAHAILRLIGLLPDHERLDDAQFVEPANHARVQARIHAIHLHPGHASVLSNERYRQRVEARLARIGSR